MTEQFLLAAVQISSILKEIEVHFAADDPSTVSLYVSEMNMVELVIAHVRTHVAVDERDAVVAATGEAAASREQQRRE